MKKQVYLNAVLLLLGATGFPDDAVSLRLVNGQAEVRFQSLSNRQYTVEFSTNLMTWIPLEEGIFESGYVTCTNQLAGQQKCFYRTKRSSEFSVSFNPACFEIGSERTYSISETVNGETTNYTRVERNDRYVIKNGFNSIECNAYSNGTERLETEYILADLSGGLFFVGADDPDEGEVFYNPPYSSSFNQFVPDAQSTPVTLPAPDPESSELTCWETLSIDYGTVTVSAGSFQNTIKITEHASGVYYSIYGDIPYTIVAQTWYAKEVGEIKSTMSGDFEVYGNFMTGSEELISYNF